MNHNMMFDLGDDVALKLSNESGQVIARSEWLSGENQYLVRYKAGDGRQVESWWSESALRLDPKD